MEREKEINAFNSTSSYKVTGIFLFKKDGNSYEVKAELPEKFDKKEEAIAFLNKCIGAEFTDRRYRNQTSEEITTSTIYDIHIATGSKQKAWIFSSKDNDDCTAAI